MVYVIYVCYSTVRGDTPQIPHLPSRRWTTHNNINVILRVLRIDNGNTRRYNVPCVRMPQIFQRRVR